MHLLSISLFLPILKTPHYIQSLIIQNLYLISCFSLSPSDSSCRLFYHKLPWQSMRLMLPFTMNATPAPKSLATFMYGCEILCALRPFPQYDILHHLLNRVRPEVGSSEAAAPVCSTVPAKLSLIIHSL